jgi:hypothetical protein
MYPNRLGEPYDRYKKHETVSVNSNQYENKMYNEVYKNANNLSLNEIIDYDTETHFLVVSSADRDPSKYPKSSKFTFDLSREFKNVVQVELVQAIIPDKNSVTSEPYLLLKIDELTTTMESVNQAIAESFAILQLAPPTTSNGFIQLDKRIAENVVLYYETPKASLSKMSVNINDYTGANFEFGGDNTTDKAFQITFVLKIVCNIKSRKNLGFRNVF